MTLLCRGYLKVKPFDFDTTWMDKYQNLNKMIFWREDDHEGMLHATMSLVSV
jgi:hypothetical protein